MGKTRKKYSTVPRPAILKILKKLALNIRKMAEVERVVLFGSHAKGLERADSDIDLCIVFSNNVKNIKEIGGRISIQFNYYQQIAADIIVCYEREYTKNMVSPILHEVRTFGIEV